MRRGLYFVLMVVLVLRGLTGTAMAAGVLPQLLTFGLDQQHQTQTHTQMHDPIQDELQGGHAAAAVSASGLLGSADPAHANHHDAHTVQSPCDDANAQDGADCAAHDQHSATCSACEICHSAMLDTPSRMTLAFSPVGNSLPLAAAPFDSAPAALVIKPPIA